MPRWEHEPKGLSTPEGPAELRERGKMHKPRGFKMVFLLELLIQLQRRASRVSTKFGCSLQCGKFKANAVRPRGLNQIFGNFLPFHFVSAAGVEVCARQLFARLRF